jgi:hypothetical protein
VLISLYVNGLDGASGVETVRVLTMVPILVNSRASYALRHVQESFRIEHPRQSAVLFKTATQ